MSLKGYEFLNDSGTEVVARYFFKDETLYLYEEITDEKMKEIEEYLKDHKWEIIHVVDFKKEVCL